MTEDRDSSLDWLRNSPSDRCWWCGDLATTREHKFKASDLRRIAIGENGASDASNVFKGSSRYEGVLRTIRRGTEVQWGKNLCARCNGSRSQPFDRAYERFSDFIQLQIDALHMKQDVAWSAIYNSDWSSGPRNLARYFGKQLGCMLATQDLHVPRALIEFLDGADRCPPVNFSVYLDPVVVDAHVSAVENGYLEGMRNFIGLPETPAYSDGKALTGAQYACRLAYLFVDVEWRDGTDTPSFFEFDRLRLLPLR